MKQAYIKYLLALLLFGTNGIVASHIALNSYEIVLTRSGIGSLLLLAIFWLSKGKFTFWQYKRQSFFLVASGMAMGASWMFLYEAYQQVGVSVASLAYYCGPIIIMPFLFWETLTWRKGIGFLVVLCGIVLINGQILGNSESGWGLFCGGMSAVMYALMVIFNKNAQSITGLENAMIQLVISFFYRCCLSLFQTRAWVYHRRRRLVAHFHSRSAEYRGWLLFLFFFYWALACANSCHLWLSRALIMQCFQNQ